MRIDDKRVFGPVTGGAIGPGFLTRMCAQAPQRGCESHRVHQIADQ